MVENNDSYRNEMEVEVKEIGRIKGELVLEIKKLEKMAQNITAREEGKDHVGKMLVG